MTLTELRHLRQHVVKRHAVLERDVRRLANDRPVRHRIGKRHAQLKDVRPLADQRVRRGKTLFKRRRTHRQIGDVRRPPLFPAPCKRLLYAIHFKPPNFKLLSSTSCTP